LFIISFYFTDAIGDMYLKNSIIVKGVYGSTIWLYEPCQYIFNGSYENGYYDKDFLLEDYNESIEDLYKNSGFYYNFLFDSLFSLHSIYRFHLNINSEVFYVYFNNYYLTLNYVDFDVDYCFYILKDFMCFEFKNYYTTELFNTKKGYSVNSDNVESFYTVLLIDAIFGCVVSLFISLSKIERLDSFNDIFIHKLNLYAFTFSKQYRLNFNITFISIFLLIDCFLFAIMQINDNSVEFIELVHISLFYFIVLIIVKLLLSYSIHYFSFLEQSVIEGKTSQFILKQFIRDISNTFALLLRFFLLLFRLNIYDGLDDFLDSYCIFFCEYNDNIENEFISLVEYDNFNLTFNSNSSDNNINSYENDLTFLVDFFLFYFSNFVEILNYWLFLLEEIFRLFLAFYIIYLIIFEVHSVNLSYTEDFYFTTKK